MSSLDHLKTFLESREVPYHCNERYGETRWKWCVQFYNIEVYLLNSCRYFAIKRGTDGLMLEFSYHIQSKNDLIKKIEEWLGEEGKGRLVWQ